MKLVFENKRRINEELWDSSRVLDLTRYFLDKYPYADDDAIMKAIKKQMTKEGSTLPSDDSEFRRAYFDSCAVYMEEQDMYDESLSKKKMNEEAISSSARKCEVEIASIMYSINRWMEKWVDYLDPEQLKDMALKAVEKAYEWLLEDLDTDD